MKFSESINYNGEELEVSGEVYAASRGARERGTGLQLEPDEDASLEIESVIYKGIEVWDIMETAAEDIEELVWKALNDREPDYE